MKFKVEICANSLESALIAQRGGADRVELCDAMSEGGTTPSYGTMAAARDLLKSTKLNIIIRPRGGDFLYNDREMDIMLRDIELARKLGADGIVTGVLTAMGHVDVPHMRELISTAGDMSITFHRAFDMCADYAEALENIIALGCHRILTSGGADKAVNGLDNLGKMVEAAKNRIIIMPGSGINPDNIELIAHKSGACEFHLSARKVHDSKMIYRNTSVSMSGASHADEYSYSLTDLDTVKKVVSLLHNI